MNQPSIPDDASIIKPAVAALQKNFKTGGTRDLAFRKNQLNQLLIAYEEMIPEINVALKQDLGFQRGQANHTEVPRQEMIHFRDNLTSYAKSESVDSPAFLMPVISYVVPEPLGVVLIIGSWNYPFYTTLNYVACAIAAGNCVVLKPSEAAGHSSKLLAKLFKIALDERFYRCIEGKVEVAKAICKEKFDAIVFTGSTEKGKLVAQAAAENLTPCYLELGGKSPTIIDETADLQNAALRIAQGRFLNAGQTCVAPDYVFVHESIKKDFLERLKAEVKNFFTEDPKTSKDYSRIINEFHVDRLQGLITGHGGTVELGGQCDKKDFYVAPTIISNPKVDSKVMQEEIFGPILPIFSFKDISEVIEFINARPKPLALYYFGAFFSPNKKRIINETSSGGMVTNDCVYQLGNIHYPFGGVGMSGNCKLGGKQGFKNLSNMKTVMERGTWNFPPFNVRYPPETDFKGKMMLTMMRTLSIRQGEILKIVGGLLLVFILYKLNCFSAVTRGALSGGK